jgi:hypothetical protein
VIKIKKVEKVENVPQELCTAINLEGGNPIPLKNFECPER